MKLYLFDPQQGFDATQFGISDDYPIPAAYSSFANNAARGTPRLIKAKLD